ncbi:hypothetical protein RJ639_002750 [Escallonia herrerae]|uniref:ethanolamine-phosphate cytidylyltransferase n=1 Tax=Escallonia herrerae TaxID=1293975 RepID=A0AA88VZ77_9ASTE|nr:hypothetical protein RJ639_002750 [Escallonia herrerae]
MVVSEAGGRSESILQTSRSLATWIIGGVVLGVSVAGLCLAYPERPLAIWGMRRKKKKGPVRVYMDGCFDMMHYGHCNALRQARALGDQLVVGVVSDAEITANKGPPVTPLHERMIMVSAVKWVDEVIPDAPYAITEDFMKKLFDEYNIDYIIHGDDPCLLPDGTDAYALAKKAGRYKQIKRTEGVSSTDIVDNLAMVMVKNLKMVAPVVEHVFLIFYLHHEESCNSPMGSANRGAHRPIMNLHERSLSVLACRYVDEVIIGAPWEVSKDMITTFNISLVVHGTIAEDSDFAKEKRNPYDVPSSMGILKLLESPLDITTSTIIRRIVSNHEAYQKRNERKAESERRYYEDKSFVSGD